MRQVTRCAVARLVSTTYCSLLVHTGHISLTKPKDNGRVGRDIHVHRVDLSKITFRQAQNVYHIQGRVAFCVAQDVDEAKLARAIDVIRSCGQDGRVIKTIEARTPSQTLCIDGDRVHRGYKQSQATIAR